MFAEWETFYLIVGSAPAALIGLMFVVITLTGELADERAVYGARAYLTPIVVHYSLILGVSALTTVPGLREPVLAGLIAVFAVVGGAYAASTTVRLFLPRADFHPDWEDRVFYGLVPLALYALLGNAAVISWRGDEAATYIVAAAVLLLLLVGIRNTWDLATWLILHRRKQP